MFGRIGYFGLLQTSVFLSFSPFWCLKRLPSPLFPLFSPLRKIWAPFTGTLFLLFFSSSFFFWSEVSRETPLQFHPWFLFYPKFLISRAAALLGWTEKKENNQIRVSSEPSIFAKISFVELVLPSTKFSCLWRLIKLPSHERRSGYGTFQNKATFCGALKVSVVALCSIHWAIIDLLKYWEHGLYVSLDSESISSIVSYIPPKSSDLLHWSALSVSRSVELGKLSAIYFMWKSEYSVDSVNASCSRWTFV